MRSGQAQLEALAAIALRAFYGPCDVVHHATFLGWLGGEDLPRVYASADMFLFASQTDTFGQVVLEAQASGLPVVAVDAGGPSSLIEDGVTGLLTGADEYELAAAILSLVDAPLLSERLRRTALAEVRGRTWETALERLAAGYVLALHEHAPQPARSVA
jgi:glycosyltransferase involved in cell wall biosynthesis